MCGARGANEDWPLPRVLPEGVGAPGGRGAGAAVLRQQHAYDGVEVRYRVGDDRHAAVVLFAFAVRVRANDVYREPCRPPT